MKRLTNALTHVNIRRIAVSAGVLLIEKEFAQGQALQTGQWNNIFEQSEPLLTDRRWYGCRIKRGINSLFVNEDCW